VRLRRLWNRERRRLRDGKPWTWAKPFPALGGTFTNWRWFRGAPGQAAFIAEWTAARDARAAACREQQRLASARLTASRLFHEEMAAP
jgi:hypothetical protein